MLMFKKRLAAVCWLALIAPFALAQNTSLSGRVTDESGAVVPAAKVILTGPEGLARTATAAGDGSYSFKALPPGTYTLSASAPSLAMREPVLVNLQAASQTIHLQMKVVGVEQRVTVQENAGATVNTDPANNAGALVIRGADLQALSDDPEDLQSDLQGLAGPSAGPSGGTIFIDGFSGGELPPKESIREIRINQNPFSPEYDKLGYGRIEIFTKPGTEKWHGTIAYNYANSIFNSRNPYAAEKAPLLLNESENTVSGPLSKRASFTFDVEAQAVNNGAIINAIVLDPSTLAPNPYTAFNVTPQRRLRISPRLDYQLNDYNTLSVRYTFTRAGIADFGIGGFDLVPRGYHLEWDYNTLQLTETAVLNTAVNETRFQFFRVSKVTTPNNPGEALLVAGAFNDGGAQTGNASDAQHSYELQNYTSIVKGAHSFRFGVRLIGQTEDSILPQNFGGTFFFNSLNAYSLTLMGIENGLNPGQIRASGGGAAQFSINAGTLGLAVNQVNVGIFGGDDWKLLPNLTMSMGVRWEAQTNISDYRDWAPRVALAWAPGGGANRSSKTVIRGGFGMFYDRFALANTLTADRYNGIVQQQYVISNPNFYPVIPPISLIEAVKSPQIIQEIDSGLRAPYIMQSALTLERQLPKNITASVTYTNSHGVHELRSQDINAPLPGTYDPTKPGSGVFPYGNPNPIFLMTSAGLYNQNQLVTNVSARINPQISLFGYYVYNRAMSNSDGLSTFPADPYNYAGEYGPAATDIHNRFLVGGSLNTKWNFRISPFVIVQSGAPFNITSGNDQFGTTLFNARPGIATDPSKPGVVDTIYGPLDPNPSPGEEVLSRNYGRGPGQITMNVRIGKTFGFGPERGGSNARAGSRPTGVPNLAAPGGMRGFFSPPTTNRRFNLTISLSARNILNRNNPGPIIGNIQSPLFGMANQTAGGPNGEGFSENANNRRFELQTRFTF
jgi:hypothetical protein